MTGLPSARLVAADSSDARGTPAGGSAMYTAPVYPQVSSYTCRAIEGGGGLSQVGRNNHGCGWSVAQKEYLKYQALRSSQDNKGCDKLECNMVAPAIPHHVTLSCYIHGCFQW